MNFQFFRNILFVFYFILAASGFATAQYWQQEYGGTANEWGRWAIELADSSFMVLCRSNTAGDYLMHVEQNGSEMERDSFGELINITRVEGLLGGGFMVLGMDETETFQRPFLKKYDSNANELWTTFYRDTFTEDTDFWELQYADDFTELADGSIVFHSIYNAEATDTIKDFISKVTIDGTLVWEKVNNTTNGGFIPRKLITLSDNTILINGEIYFDGEQFVKIDEDGNVLWTQDYGTVFSLGPEADMSGGFISWQNPTSLDGVVFRFEGNGNASILDQEPLSFYSNSIINLPDDSFLAFGNIEEATPGSEDFDFYLKRFFAPEDATWQEREYFKPLNQGASHVICTSDGGYLMIGFTESTLAGNNVYLVKVDSTGSMGATLNGDIKQDLDLDCEVDDLESGLSGFYVVAENEMFTNYAVTDQSGSYTMDLGLGAYDIYAVPPSTYWEMCTDTISVDLFTLFDTTIVDLAAQAEIECPYLEVDITTPFLRRCFPNTYWVNYCNYGTIGAEAASIEVILDEDMIVDSTSIPISSVIDSLYIFDVGDLEVGDCGTFRIHFRLDPDCEATLLGETHCVEAHIFPDDPCDIDEEWTGANVELSAECGQDTLTFFIQNTGTGNMAGPLAYIIIEDEVILRERLFQLDAGEIKIEQVPANGSTYRLEAQQEPNHPSEIDVVSIAVEGCGLNEMAEISLGFINLYPDHDDDPFLSIDCQENAGSFDPNDKQGFPLGYGAQNNIDQNESLEYMIRFQNTGTDTAFTVVILDTLSTWLDPASVRPGASSHLYRFSIEGEGILRFTFDNILLPDSTTNLERSNGFVKFEIDQKRDNPIGTEILNRAAIFFDFNDPVITNTTLHTIGEDYIIVSNQEVFIQGVEVDVYPNPFAQQVTFEIKENTIPDLELHVYDVAGRLILFQQFEENRLELYRKQLTSGIYFYKIESRGQAIGSGKIIMQ